MPVNSYHYEESSLVVNPNPVAVLDGAGEATTFEYSPEGDILKITDPTGVFTAFEYDEHHDIVAMLNPAGEAIRFTRDAAGQVTSVSNPLGATTTLEYNAAGVLTSFTNPLGHAGRSPTRSNRSVMARRIWCVHISRAAKPVMPQSVLCLRPLPTRREIPPHSPIQPVGISRPSRTLSGHNPA